MAKTLHTSRACGISVNARSDTEEVPNMIRRYTHRPAVVLLPTLLLVGSVLADRGGRLTAPPPTGANSAVGLALAQAPMTLEPNHGQAASDVQFTAHGQSYTMQLRPDEARISMWTPAPKRAGAKKSRSAHNQPGAPDVDMVEANIRMRVVGGNPKAPCETEGEQETRVNYLKGNDPSKYVTNIPVYEKVRYKEVYPGIDLVYYGNQEHYEYDFEVAPGVSPGEITLQFDGAKSLRIDDNGDLLASVDGGELRHGRPVIYQEIFGRREEVSGSYALLPNNQVGFNVDGYDPSRPLVIDPPVIGFSGFLGGISFDQAHDVLVDSDGYVYVVGITRSGDYPVTPAIPPSGDPVYDGGPGYTQGYDLTYNGGDWDLFITKIAPPNVPTAGETRARVIYSTFFGGQSADMRKAIPGAALKRDSSGRLHFICETYSTNYPTTAGALFPTKPSTNGTEDIGFSILSADGTTLLYSTFYGGNQSEWAGGLDLDDQNRVVITGRTFSPPDSFPLLNWVDNTMGNNQEGFVACLEMNFGTTPATATNLFSTYLGGNLNEGADSVAVRRDGATLNVYTCGNTYSTADFPLSRSLQTKLSDNSADAFVTKLQFDTGTNALSIGWSTLFGGFAEEQAYGVAVDSTGDVYVTGLLAATPKATMADPYSTGSSPTNIPTVAGLAVTGQGNGDAFLIRLGEPLDASDPATSTSGRVQLKYFTAFGGERHDEAAAISLDPVLPGVAWITGYTISLTSDPIPFPTANSVFDTKTTIDEAAFAAKLDTAQSGSNTLLVSTLIDGNKHERGFGIAATGDNCPVLVGYTGGGTYPAVGGPQLTYGGGDQDGFVTKVCPGDLTGLQIYKVDVTLVSATTAVVTWQTNRPASSLVRYGTSSGVYTKNTSPHSGLSSDTSGNVFTHRVTIGDSLGTTTDQIGNASTDSPLTPGTLYYVQVESSTPDLSQTAQNTAPAFLTSPLFPKFTITSTTFRSNSTNFFTHAIIKNTGGASADSVQFTRVRFKGTGGKSAIFQDPQAQFTSGSFSGKSFGIPEGSGAYPGTLAVGQTGRVQYQYSNTLPDPGYNAWNAGQSALIDIQGTYTYPGGGTASFAATHRVRMPTTGTSPTRRPINGRTVKRRRGR